MIQKTSEERKKLASAYQKTYRQQNRERLKIKRRQYYEANREKIIRRQLVWFRSHKPKRARTREESV